MFCGNCGKDISDDSIFCYSCGSKIEIKEKQETISDTHLLVSDIKNTSINNNFMQNFSEKKDDEPIVTSTDQALPPQKKILSFGLVVLLSFYGYSISQWSKIHIADFSIITIIVMILCFPLLIFLYFKLKYILLKRKYFIDKVGFSSLISGFLSLIFVMLIIGFATGIDGSIQRKYKIREMTEFSESFIKQTQEYKKQELQYSKLLMSESKTNSELKDKISIIDDYKIFLQKKNKHVMTLINFFREINSKYKKDKSVDEQINKLEIMNRDISNSSINSMDKYKQYLITGDEKYYNQVQQEYQKQQPLKFEVDQLITNISKSL